MGNRAFDSGGLGIFCVFWPAWKLLWYCSWVNPSLKWSILCRVGR